MTLQVIKKLKVKFYFIKIYINSKLEIPKYEFFEFLGKISRIKIKN